MRSKAVLICGDALVDVHLNLGDVRITPHVQLGGVFHSARTLSAIKQPFGLAFAAPSYLLPSIAEFSSGLGALDAVRLGYVDGAPNVMLIGESTEAGDQGFVEVLREQKRLSLNWETLESVSWDPYRQVLLYPGEYDWIGIKDYFVKLGKEVHVDLQYVSPDELTDLDVLKGFHTIFVSTTSPMFQQMCMNDPASLSLLGLSRCRRMILKENRGGSRLFDCTSEKWIEAPCYPVRCLHSVGVGDCYNAAFLSATQRGETDAKALHEASMAAAIYASTLDFEELEAILPVLSDLDYGVFCHVRLPWEERHKLSVYLAGPDFPRIDTTVIDQIEKNLRYHNFNPRRPIKENGLISGEETVTQELQVFQADLDLLHECQLLIAVALAEDPGAMAELGYFRRMNRPAILYDPFRKIDNMFVRRLVSKVCYTLNDLTDAVFLELGGLK
jgi:nucleoside 2-deoxyribosyltransferase